MSADADGGETPFVDLSEIFGTAEYEVSSPPAREFKPWHKPRKQFIRSRQWRNEVARLARSRTDPARPVNYLTLPGPDLLDIRHCLHAGDYTLCFLGFDTSAVPGSPDLSSHEISMHEMKRHARIDQRSDVIGDDFSLLADRTSVAWERMSQYGTYDVVNLDLCGSFSSAAPTRDSLYAAIHNVMQWQSRRVESWSFLLTTRVTTETLFPTVGMALTQEIVGLFRDCPEFARELSRSTRSIADALEGGIASIRQLDAESFFLAYVFALCRWLEGLVGRDKFKLELKSVLDYRVNDGATYSDMASLAIRFEPVHHGAADPMGIAPHNRVEIDTCDEASQLYARVLDHSDVDAMLERNEVLREEMIMESAQLLEEARYDAFAYVDWAYAMYEDSAANESA